MRIAAEKTLSVAAQTGVSLTIRKDQVVRLTDVEGAQVADLFACLQEDHSEWLSTGHTRTKNARLFPKVGQGFCTQKYRTILRFLADRSPGQHDMFYPSCDAQMYQRLGAGDDHPNCVDNFRSASMTRGWMPAVTPEPVNFFQNTPCTRAGDLEVLSATTQAGDHVILQAAEDIILVVTACSQDLVPLNGAECTGLLLEVFNPSLLPMLLYQGA